ncbi:MAG: glycosyltransferase family 2 protein [Phyllobacterium sp.]
MTDKIVQLEIFKSESEPLEPGHYTLTMALPSGWDSQASHRAYIEPLDKNDPVSSVLLKFRRKISGKFSADFSLHLAARRIWFERLSDTSTNAPPFVEIRKQPQLRYYARLAWRVVKHHRETGRPLSLIANRALNELRLNGFKGISSLLRLAENRTDSLNGYQEWIARHDILSQQELSKISNEIAGLDNIPKISVLMPVYNTPDSYLHDAIESVLAQIYPNWELCIADDCSTDPRIRPILEAYEIQDPRIKVAYRSENGHISQASNTALELVTGDWVALLDHDDLLRPHALAEVALEIAYHPDAELIYSDEDKIKANGERFDPYFKPDYSRELFRSQNYFNHLTVHRTVNIRAVDGWRTGFEGSQDYDISLRVLERINPSKIRHIPKILYHWRAVEGSTAVAGTEKSYAHLAGLRALREHAERLELSAVVETAPETPFYRFRFLVPDPSPLVSLIIPTKDKVDLLRGCVNSIVEKTDYQNLEIIIVDNGSKEKKTLVYLSEIEKRPDVRVLRYDKPFNYSAINNFAVAQAKGSIIGLINNDIEVISTDWLTEMVSWTVQSDIGCVGAKLYYGDDTIQHAGVILGIGGTAGHSHKHADRHSAGYYHRLKVVQNLSAVTGACLLVRKDVFNEVGGLNEEHLSVAFNDIDFCLKVRKAGYQNVWTPYAELYHLESVSRGAEDTPEKLARFQKENSYLHKTWDLTYDPYYSIHLTREREDFSIRV